MKRCFTVFALLLSLSSCYVFKAYRFRKFKLEDLPKLDAATLPPATTPFLFSYDTTRYPQMVSYLDENLRQSQSYAFLVIRNDTILYERYFGTVTDSSLLPSFSVAKSVTGTLVGIALQEGYIKSLSEPVTNYLPQLLKVDKGYAAVTIQDVLNMRSGVRSNEGYSNPFSDVLKLGFAANVSKHALKAGLERPTGAFQYKSVNTQLLALIIEKATGRKLQAYAVEKLWAPLQTEHTATWNVDKQQTARAFCCINAAARDYAKFGRLYLNNGRWQGRQVVPESWVAQSVSADTMFRNQGYKNQWWAGDNIQEFDDSLQAAAFANAKKGTAGLPYLRKSTDGRLRYRVKFYSGAYHAEGLLGQYVYVNPNNKVVIVRLGHDWSHPNFYAEQFIYNLGEGFKSRGAAAPTL